MPRKTKETRRGKNEGSVYRRKDGKWVGQVTVGYRPDDGKSIREYTYTNTREEAAQWVALTLASNLNQNVSIVPEDLILKDFLHHWLTTFKAREVYSRTMELYYYSERAHIVPSLGGIPLDSMTPLKIQTFLYQLDVSTTLGVYSHVVPEVFSGVTAVVNQASQKLLSGTYAPKRSLEQVRQQLQQLDPLLAGDMGSSAHCV